MWIRTQTGQSIIELTGWHMYKDDVEFQNLKKYTINITKDYFDSDFIVVASYENKKIRDSIMELFEAALLNNQNIFSFEYKLIMKYLEEIEKKMKGQSNDSK